MAKRKSTYLRPIIQDPGVVLRPVVRTSDRETVEEIVTMESAPAAPTPAQRARDLALERDDDAAADDVGSGQRV